MLTVIVFGNKLYYYIRQHFPFTEKPLASIINMRAILSLIVLFLFSGFYMLYCQTEKLNFQNNIPVPLSQVLAGLPFHMFIRTM